MGEVLWAVGIDGLGDEAERGDDEEREGHEQDEDAECHPAGDQAAGVAPVGLDDTERHVDR